MIGTEDFLIPLTATKALLVSDSQWGLAELDGLLKTLGGESCETLLLPKRRIEPGTYVGKGKLEEIQRILEARDLDLLLVDFDLSPSQLKNIEKVLGKKRLILDRSGIILEIFNRHARSKEAKLQVEIARLEYLMPRLTHLWSHFERQRGSGGGALKGKGMGEKQIEVDRRLVKDRLVALKRRLGEAEASRDLHRRKRDRLLKVALVGYTNAGKSTLLNALTHSEVYVEDELFATLDATVRLLNPKSRPAILGIDTVGFIDRLPHSLVASFRSTLGEALEADLLIQVLDASDSEVPRHFDVTMSVLAEIGAVERVKTEGEPDAFRAKIPMLVVFNKMDRCKDVAMTKVWGASLTRKHGLDAPIYLSARSKEDVHALRDRILAFFDREMETYEVVIPFEDGKALARVYEFGNVQARRNTEKGVFVRFRTLPEFARALSLDQYRF